jgi:hypothetical protein
VLLGDGARYEVVGKPEGKAPRAAFAGWLAPPMLTWRRSGEHVANGAGHRRASPARHHSSTINV